MMSVKSKQKNNSKQFYMEKKRNLWVIPTEKPSRLFNCFGKLGIGDYITTRENLQVTNQNIYITSDEEIKAGEWVTNGLAIMKANLNGQPTMDDYHPWRKIILTTDQDLIKDGVQAIDDEFLEWFVKNPSCESVETVFNNRGITGAEKILKTFGEYEIIIPKEEAKEKFPQIGTKEFNDLASAYFGGKPKQETLEEVELAILFHNTYEKLAPSFGYETRLDTKLLDITTPNGKLMIAVCKEIIKWQQERMYSKKDMQSFIKIRNYFGENDKTSFEHFAYSFLNGVIEQFKNK